MKCQVSKSNNWKQVKTCFLWKNIIKT